MLKRGMLRSPLVPELRMEKGREGKKLGWAGGGGGGKRRDRQETTGSRIQGNQSTSEVQLNSHTAEPTTLKTRGSNSNIQTSKGACVGVEVWGWGWVGTWEPWKKNLEEDTGGGTVARTECV